MMPPATMGMPMTGTPGAAGSSGAAAPGGAAGSMAPMQNPMTKPDPMTMAGSSADPMMEPMTMDPGTMTGMPTLPPVDNVDAMGPFEVTIDMNGPGGGWLAYPTELGKNGMLHPIFTWGCGGGSQPSQYEDHMRRIASHGFVMEAHVSSGEASDHKTPVDWLFAENEKMGSKFYHKLDLEKLAVGGHSMGSVATFAFEGSDDRVVTSIHVAGGSFDGNGYMSFKTPVLMVEGSGDTLALSNTDRDYEKTTVPVFYTTIQGSDHIYAARDGLPPIVAWLRWHLGGETERKSMFVGASCDFCGGKWMGKSKNW
jgi:hypothetical protein